MKKVGIMTLHFSINYGAVLQCMALEKYLTLRGNDVEVIDYVPVYLLDFWKPWISPLDKCKNRLIYCGKNPIKTACIMIRTFCEALLENKSYFYKKRKYDKFNRFVEKNIKKTADHFDDISELDIKSSNYDVIISGSDQVWNPGFTKGEIDSAYLLDFGKGYVRTTYAASSGISQDEFVKKLAGQIRNIEHISVREKSLADSLNAIDNNLNVRRVIDPTLLFSGREWRKYENNDVIKNDDYIFVYCLKQHDEFAQVLDLLKKKLKCRVIDLSPQQVCNAMKDSHNCSDCGPAEFLAYIDHAKYVITNSFHATVFSILFEKNFLTIPDKGTGSRMIDLLEDFELTERIYNKNCNIEAYLSPVDFRKTKVIQEKLRAEADNYFIESGV